MLNGIVDYNNDQKYDFSDNVFSTTVTASIDWKRDNLTLGVYADFTTGKVPEINRFLPDSDIHGALDPEYSLSSSPSASFGFCGRLKF
jgi:hypothetical protein